MADISLTNFSPSNTMPPMSDCVGGLMAGATIAAGNLVTIRADGLVYPFVSGTDVVIAGFAPGSATVGFPCSIYRGQRYGCSAVSPGTSTPVNLTAGTYLYPAASTPGGVATSASNSNPAVAFVARANNSTNVNTIQAIV